MTDIYKYLYDTLAPLGYPVREQGTYSADDVLPETHITYYMIDESDKTHYDNIPVGKATTFRIFFYSQRPALKQLASDTLKAVMLPAGFLRGPGRSMPYDPSTGHYGYMSLYKIYKTEVL